jgi:hypothetical protein
MGNAIFLAAKQRDVETLSLTLGGQNPGSLGTLH